jgi:hypothetical protein
MFGDAARLRIAYGLRYPGSRLPAPKSVLMALNFQAFIDDSYSSEDFVIGGYIGTAETWAAFAKDWEVIRPLGTRAKNGRQHFKMSEMAHQGRM